MNDSHIVKPNMNLSRTRLVELEGPTGMAHRREGVDGADVSASWEPLRGWGVRTGLARSIAETPRVRLLAKWVKVLDGVVVPHNAERHHPAVFELHDRFASLRADWVCVQFGLGHERRAPAHE